MKKTILLFVLIAQFIHSQNITIFNDVPFYSMYHYLNQGNLDSEAFQNLPPEAFSQIPMGAIRSHAYERDVISRKLTTTEINSLGDNITLNVTLFAACDNYDRIAGVNLVLVPKNSTTYSWNATNIKRIEIGRFITPFMNKNISPTQVPFSWQINNLSKILKDSALLLNYDMWIEFRADGYSAAAQNEVSGCANRTDVFRGSLELVTTNSGIPNTDIHLLEPIVYRFNFNNYQPNAFTNTYSNYTEKEFIVNLTEPIDNAKLYLITSKHGANQGGEEYIRRYHYIYLNNNSVHSYVPNESPSCEPYRMYNTQGNGIYGANPQSDAWWSSWNNWCPGDKIPTKEIALGNLTAGQHTIKFRLSGANLFTSQQGSVSFSAYIQGKKTILNNEKFNENNFTFYPNPAQEEVFFNSENKIKEIELFNSLGQSVLKSNETKLNLKKLSNGIYITKISFLNGDISYSKIIKE
ncbi:MAG: peptide-N-glycosidase F-related protein [Flavobacterium sp.]